MVGRYPTGDGHELVVHTTGNGVVAIVQYDHWALVVGWNRDRTAWPQFAEALNAHESADGFLVIEPVSPWVLGPTDSPDVQLGRTDGGAAYSFFGSEALPVRLSGRVDDEHPNTTGLEGRCGRGGARCDAARGVDVQRTSSTRSSSASRTTGPSPS